MSDPLPPPVAPISWVVKSDGRQVPFEADKISRALYAASLELGLADAFLCRELTDSVLHFLAQELAGQTPTTGAVRELVAKVVRELGHPALALKYQEGQGQRSSRTGARTKAWGLEQVEWLVRRMGDRLAPGVPVPQQAQEAYLSSHFALSQVFTSDLLSVQADGLINLGGVRSCRRMAAALVPHQSDPLDLIECMSGYRRATGGVLIFDSPERKLGAPNSDPAVGYSIWRRALLMGLGDQGCRAIVNLNRRAVPGEVPESFLGPLFAPSSTPPSDKDLSKRALDLCDELLKLPPEGIRIDWHLAEADFVEEQRALLAGLVHRAAAGQPLSFVFDRTKRPPRLAEGVTTAQNAVLAEVGLHLPQLARQMGLPRTPERFLTKLVSLVRLALSAATQKRSLLRRLKEENSLLAQGFFLEKARVILAPIGLDAVVREFMGEGCCSRAPAPGGFACQILEKIRNTAREDGKALLLDAVIDSPLFDLSFPAVAQTMDSAGAIEQTAGVTTWDDQAPLLRQVNACGSLHEAAQGGTALIQVSKAVTDAVEDLVDALKHAWAKTNVLALRFVNEPRRRDEKED
jgi:ATP cone domain